MIPISVVIITKNEERNIEDALASASGFDEIVVVDSFSDDKTVEICRKYTDRIFFHEWQGYARQKQTAVNYAKNDWTLILDADERITPNLKSEIIAALDSRAGYAGFYLPRKNYFLGRWIRHSGWWPDYTLRLFRKELSYIEQREVHEKVIVKGMVGFLKEPIEHHSYRTLSEYITKMENYTAMSAVEINKRKRYPLISMIFSPPFVFIKMFFIRQGFMDGVRGLILSLFYSFYTFLKYAKAWEKRLNLKKY
ncbi:MAG: glycosyltransferase family 2 protein [Nitrospirae bacterium]|nr:glycosyltransferase family 2 protein [Nitrospirota bacterium]